MSKIKRKRTDLPAALAHIEGFDAKAVLRRRGVFLRLRTNHELKQAATPLAAVLVKKQRSSNKKTTSRNKTDRKIISEPQRFISFTDDDAAAYWEKQIHNVSTLEEHFDKAVKQFLTNYVLPKALAKLQSIVDNNKGAQAQAKALQAFTKQVFDDSEEQDLVNEAQINLEPLLQNMAVIAGQDANKLIGVNDPYVPSDALRKRVQANVEKFTQSMVDTDQAKLTNLIVAGIEEGKSIQEIRSAITDDFGDYSNMQADLITRTEVMRAANQSTLDAFIQSGVVEGKQWLTAGAEDECSDYEGKVESLDGEFYASTDDFTDGDPPLHPNCRCVLIPVLINTGEGISASDGEGDV